MNPEKNSQLSVFLAIGEMQSGQEERALEMVQEARSIGLKSVEEYTQSAFVMGNSSAAWSEVQDLFLEGRDRFPSSARIAYQHGRYCQIAGDNFSLQSVGTVIPAMRHAQQLAAEAFHSSAVPLSRTPGSPLRCSGKRAAVVYDWGRAEVSDTVTSYTRVDLHGPVGSYGWRSPRRWSGLPADVRDQSFTWGSLMYEEREAFVSELTDVFVSGVDGVLFDARCRIFAIGHDEETRYYESLPPPQFVATASPLASAINLVQVWGLAPYHIIAEAMSRVYLLQRVWRADPSIPFLYGGPGNSDRLVRIMLESLFDVAPSRLTPMNSLGALVRVGKLHFADWRRMSPEGVPVRDDGRLYHYLPPRRVLQQLHSYYAQRYKGVAGATNDQPRILLWLSRGGSEKRQVAPDRESGLLKRMTEIWSTHLGSETNVRVLGKFPPFADVHRLFYTAAAVAGVHGAGLGNVLFCQTGTHVVEVACQQPHCHYFGHLSMALDFQYWFVPLTPRHAHLQRFVEPPEEELLGVVRNVAEEVAAAAGRAGHATAGEL